MKLTQKILVSLLAIGFTASLSAQNGFRTLNKADQAFYEYNFKKALKFYLKTYEIDTSAHVLRGVAQSYAYLQEHEKAEKFFGKLAHVAEPLPFDILEYAQSLKRVGNYDEALIWFEKYREIYPLDLRARNHSVNSYHYKKLARNKKNPLFFSLDINDEGSILGLTKYEDGIIFSKSENNGSFDFMDSPEIFLDILSASLTAEKEIEQAKFLPFTINSNLHDGPSSYHDESNTLYFTRNAALTKETKENGSQLEILTSKKVDGKWQEAEPFKFNHKEYSVGHPAISPDGKSLYFISNKPGGFGGTDIYVCKKLGKEWGAPQNLGPEVNTESDEMFPFVADGDVLYFASEGHAGLGGLDVFKTYPFEEFWAKPENLGAPVNSRANDFGLLMMAEGEAYFISDRVGGKGADDVYYVNISETKKFFSIPSKLIENKKVSPISVVNLKTGEEEFYRKGEAAFLELDISETGYKVAWNHMGEEREILINGENQQSGMFDIQLKGLEGLEPQDFLSHIEIVGADSQNKVKIDQKVWTYEKIESGGYFSDDLFKPKNYAKGKDNVITIDDEGKELRAATYPEPKSFENSSILFIDQNASASLEKEMPELEKLCSRYEEGSYFSIKLVQSEEFSPEKMEEYGAQVEQYVLDHGIPSEKIQLEWVESESANASVSESDLEVFITVDEKFSFVE